MANSVNIQIPKSGWSNFVQLYSKTYGVLLGRINKNLGLAFIKWTGNDNIPDVSTLDISLPNEYLPSSHVIVTCLTSNISNNRTNVGNMEIRTDGVCRIIFPVPNVSWTGGQATYPLA